MIIGLDKIKNNFRMTLTPLDNEYNFEIKPSKDILGKSHVEEFLIIYTH